MFVHLESYLNVQKLFLNRYLPKRNFMSFWILPIHRLVLHVGKRKACKEALKKNTLSEKVKLFCHSTNFSNTCVILARMLAAKRQSANVERISMIHVDEWANVDDWRTTPGQEDSKSIGAVLFFRVFSSDKQEEAWKQNERRRRRPREK